MTKDRIVVGFAGGSGSGKSTLLEQLQAAFPPALTVRLNLDDYYLPQDHRTMAEREKVNYDEPAALEIDLFRRHVLALKQGQPVKDAPLYDFGLHTRKKETRRLEPAPVILLDGILLYTEEQVRDLIDVRVFVDASPDIRLARRLARDIKFRDRKFEQAVQHYLTSVSPMHYKYVEPSKHFAHLIINNDLDCGTDNPLAHRIVIAGLVSVLGEMLKPST